MTIVYTEQDAIDAIHEAISDPSEDELADPDLIAKLATFISNGTLSDITKAMVCIDLTRSHDDKKMEDPS